MLPKLHRLTEKKDFQTVLKKGKMVQGKYFGVSIFEHSGVTQVGIIVSNKVSKSSVERNRIRRIVRDLSQKFIENRKMGYKLVFLAKKPVEKAEAENIKQDVQSLLSKYE